jgi:malate dehydrogenase (oxaloacetate-decarboxylating)
MIPFKIVRDEQTGEEIVEVSLSGQALLNNSLLNKSSAFPEDEREEFDLLGLLPPYIATLEEQVDRAYNNYLRKQTDLGRYIYLMSLQDRNETLFYRLLQEHITEMTPIIYTPTVGAAAQTYSHIYRRPRGLYIGFPHRERIDKILANVQYPVQVIVVTDGERILGLGDLGVGGMGIPIGKLSLYTLCAGIHPATTLPILLDVGTDNQELLTDPLYLGCRHPRVRGQEYDNFIDAFVQGVMRKFPDALLQWEDFARDNASRLLERYRDQLCTFNDDIQGTGAVTVAGLLAAVEVSGSVLSEQRIVMLGAGQAATGVADQIVAAMVNEGLSEHAARSLIWMIDVGGLVHTGRTSLDPLSRPYAQPRELLADWDLEHSGPITLADVVKHVRPTILIGAAAQPGAFTEEIVREMAQHVARPIIFPLSNPTSKSEAVPAALIAWTEGRALIATGSPFPDVRYEGQTIRIGQCNNSFIFPGVGLGVIASKARRVTDSMFIAAAQALSALSPARRDPTASLFPALEDVREVSRRVALVVGAEAQRAGVAEETTLEDLERRVEATMWTQRYLRYKRKWN